MSTFAELAASNPNIRGQYDEWRGLRDQRGEDPSDWEAFRTHVLAIGAPDPGDRPPDDFVGEDYKAAHPEWTRRWYGTAPAATTGAAPAAPSGGFQAAVERTRVQVGMEVVGSDDRSVGQVKEVHDADFLLNRRLAPDITVPFSGISKIEGSKVVLNAPAGRETEAR
jgi:hypothetical protein